MVHQYAPIVLFVYNRPIHTQKTIIALQANNLATQSDLYIFSDAPKNDMAFNAVKEVREYIKKLVKGFKSITIIEQETNLGLANSIITGVTKIINNFGKVIVVEDDLLLSTNFLDFMNKSLNFYQDNPEILSISGYNMAIKPNPKTNFDVYFAARAASWGWATWANKWQGIDWEVSDFKTFSKNTKQINLFKLNGSDMFKMLKQQQEGLNNSWAIRYCYHQFKNNLYSVYPIVSKVKNMGFGAIATHTKGKYNRFDCLLDTSNKIEFNFCKEVYIDTLIIKQFRNINGIWQRIISKILNVYGSK